MAIVVQSYDRVSDENTSNTPLASSGSFAGVWDLNDFEHALVNVKTDQDGTLFIDFGLVFDGEVVTTFTREVPVYGNVGLPQPLVKGPGRAIRVRYENGSTEQGSFVLHTSFGNNLFPLSSSDDNEILTTVTERERDTFLALQLSDINTSGYAGFIDLSDTTNWPHDRTGRIDLTATFFSIDRDNSATGYVRIGVITRIDGTDSDIAYVAGVTFEKSDDRSIIRDRSTSPSQIKCGVSGGALTKVKSDFTETEVTDVNTGTTLTGPGGSTYTPAVGDLIVAYGRTAGTYNASVSCFYHGERSV